MRPNRCRCAGARPCRAAAVAARFGTSAAAAAGLGCRRACLRLALLALRLGLGARLPLRPLLLRGLLTFGALLLSGGRAVAALIGDVFAAISGLVEHVLAVVLPVFARVLAEVFVIVPCVVVHVAAAAPAVRTVVVVVVHGGAEGDAGREANHARRDGLGRVVVLLHHDRRWRRRVDRLRVVLRHVDDLRVRRLDDDHLLAARRRLGLDVLLRGALQLARLAGLLAQALDAGKNRRAVRRERLPQARRPLDLRRHALDDVGKDDDRRKAGVEPGLRGCLLQRAALERRIRRQPLVERGDPGRLGRTHQHLRQQRIRIEGDGREEPIELVRLGGGRGRRLCGLRLAASCQRRRRHREHRHPGDEKGANGNGGHEGGVSWSWAQ